MEGEGKEEISREVHFEKENVLERERTCQACQGDKGDRSHTDNGNNKTKGKIEGQVGGQWLEEELLA